MAVNLFLQSDLNRLVKPTWDKRKGSVTTLADAPQVRGGRGVGTKVSASAVAGDLYTELLNVWSEIIITEDGAFEVPPGWPTDGTYVGDYTVPNPLPPSLTLNAGVLALDIGVQYYLQKRVHVVYFSHAGAAGSAAFRQDDLLIPFEMPYLGSGHYIGITKAAGKLSLSLRMTSSGSQEGLAKQSEFEGAGVTLG